MGVKLLAQGNNNDNTKEASLGAELVAFQKIC